MPEVFQGVVTYIFSLLTQVTTTIATNALLLIPIGVSISGAAIGLAKRLMGTGRRRR